MTVSRNNEGETLLQSPRYPSFATKLHRRGKRTPHREGKLRFPGQTAFCPFLLRNLAPGHVYLGSNPFFTREEWQFKEELLYSVVAGVCLETHSFIVSLSLIMLMEFEGRVEVKMQDEKRQGHLLEEMHSNRLPSGHNRSESDTQKSNGEDELNPFSGATHNNAKALNGKPNGDGRIEDDTPPGAKVHSTLKQEILQLEKRLQDQLTMRYALEKALGYSSSAVCASKEISMPKPTKELIREIAVLELEVMHLEQYLLSLYRRAFNNQPMTKLSSESELLHESAKLKPLPTKGKSRAPLSRSEVTQKLITRTANDDFELKCQDKLLGSSVHRSHSSLSHRAISSARISPSEDSLARALDSFHSQPLFFHEASRFSEQQNDNSGVISLAEYLGTSIADHVADTPNKLSEDMVRCMAAIYCKLADPPLVYHGLSSSPTSSFSSMSALSPQYLGDMWSPGYKRESTLDSRLVNPFRVEGLKEFSGPYNAMVEVPLICRDRRRLKDVEDMLCNYKLILHRVERVDPRKLKNDEKLAFWINVHNAIIMHAHIEHGIPEGNVKRTSLFIKAMCNIGGRSLNAAMIQGYILGCKTHYTGQWLRMLLYPRFKQKAKDVWQGYAIDQPEPLLHFALCSGSHSDPAVRVYTCDRLFEQLESAKEEYIRATVGIWEEEKIILPRIIGSYAKDTKLGTQTLVDMIQCYLPETLRMAMQRCQQSKSKKIIEWVSHNFNFRYLLSRDLAFPQIN
ncbi:hypothetical protein ZIOFF_057126 [Zingiber officinale]|uniref:Uncharacterized protein n=1 Tax=Zingiber officinale TaxID=94328 RepID=A0A8J5KI26_ZINOF|nr:hypothetical protein ZIOFF_057126 [Zingiber officinale]